MVTVNGKTLDSPEGQLLADFLSRAGFEPARVVVELNGAIVPRERYAAVTLKPNDTLEVVTFVGGG